MIAAENAQQPLLVFVAIMGGITVTAAALGTLWKIVRPIARIDEALPTLLGIAQEFKPDDGHSLIDRLGKVELATAATQKGMGELVAQQRICADELAVNAGRLSVIEEAVTAQGTAAATEQGAARAERKRVQPKPKKPAKRKKAL